MKKIIIIGLFLLLLLPNYVLAIEKGDNINLTFIIVEKAIEKGDLNRTNIRQQATNENQIVNDLQIILPQDADTPGLASIRGVLHIDDQIWTFVNESIIRIGTGRLIVNTELLVKDEKNGSTQLVNKEPYETVKVVGNTEQIVTDFIDVGVNISATPTIVSEDTIHAIIELNISEVLREADKTRRTTIPVISTRNVTSEINLVVNQLEVISELTVDKKVHNENGVPYFRRIPLIGGLFFKSSRETIVKTKLFIVAGISDLSRESIEDYEKFFEENKNEIEKDSQFR